MAKKTKTKKRTYTKFITIILLCDQYTKRMKAYGPSSLIPVRNNRLLDYHIKYLTDVFPKNEIVICTGFSSDKIEKYIQEKYKGINIRIVENQFFEETNSCESLRLCLNNINNSNVLIINGNLFFHKETISKIDTKKTCIVFEKENQTLDIGINYNNEILEHMDLGPSRKWSEIIFLNNEKAISELKSILTEGSYKKKFLFEAINQLVQNRHKIFCIENKKQSIKLDHMKSYKTAGYKK